MSKGKFALGAVIGAAAGVVAGWLTATKPGKETQTELKSKAEALKADVTEKAEVVAAKATDIAGDVKVKAMDIADDVKTEAIDLKTRAERAVEAAKKAFNSKK